MRELEAHIVEYCKLKLYKNDVTLQIDDIIVCNNVTTMRLQVIYITDKIIMIDLNTGKLLRADYCPKDRIIDTYYTDELKLNWAEFKTLLQDEVLSKLYHYDIIDGTDLQDFEYLTKRGETK